jgi:hypothetical protein
MRRWLPTQEHSMSAPATSQPFRSNPASNVVPGSVSASAEPSAAAELLLTPVLENEDPEAYDEIIARISAAVKPADFLEEIWVRDVAALVWEAFRLRRLKTCLLETAAPRGLTRVFSAFLPGATVSEIAAGWAGRDGEHVKQVEGLLDQTGLTMEHVTAEALADRIEDIERIDRMIASAEQRRSAMLREVDRHRTSLASLLRLACDEVVKAEFEDVTPRPCSIGLSAVP